MKWIHRVDLMKWIHRISLTTNCHNFNINIVKRNMVKQCCREWFSIPMDWTHSWRHSSTAGAMCPPETINNLEGSTHKSMSSMSSTSQIRCGRAWWTALGALFVRLCFEFTAQHVDTQIRNKPKYLSAPGNKDSALSFLFSNGNDLGHLHILFVALNRCTASNVGLRENHLLIGIRSNGSRHGLIVGWGVLAALHGKPSHCYIQ